MKLAFSCPTCHGHGIVSKPPWLAGDQMTWAASSCSCYPCRSCNGSGIVWSEVDYIQQEKEVICGNGL